MSGSSGVVGVFRVHGAEGWQVTTSSVLVAAATYVLMGGALPSKGSGPAWEVVTGSSVLRVVASGLDTDGLRFELPGVPGKRLLLGCGPWDVAEVLGASTVARLRQAREPVECELGVRTVQITTLGGRLVRYRVPELTLPACA
jgi:hypothetical protein